MTLNNQRVKSSHDDFSVRFTHAADVHQEVPPLHYGRLVWFRDQLSTRFQIKVSTESVRRWFSGDSRPRLKTLHALAEILQVDDSWLALGAAPDLLPRERKARGAEIDGAVSLLAGVIKMSGGEPSFPDKEGVDIYAIIRGAHYSLKVSLLREKTSAGALRFFVDPDWTGKIVIGVVPSPNHQYDFYELEPEVIEAGSHRSGAIEILVAPSDLKKIETFSSRI